MKIVAKSIEVASWNDTECNINRVRFRIINEAESNSVVKIEKVICADKKAGDNFIQCSQS